MKFSCFTSLVAAASTLSFTALAQDSSPARQFRDQEAVRLLQEDISRAGNNVNSYEFNPIHDTKAPKGYKPFYISHYGRHGSRSDWGMKHYTKVKDVLEESNEEGNLTASGDSLLAVTTELISLHNGMDGRLTRRGCEEHRRIAERMYGRYREVFKRKGTEVRAISSVVPRCIISMAAFTGELMALDPKLDISLDCGETYQQYMSHGPTKDIRNKANIIVDSLNRSYKADTIMVMERLFKDPAAARKHIPDIEIFEWDIFAVGIVADPFEMEVNALKFLPFDAVYKFFDSANASLYLAQCNSKEFGLERVPLAEPLVNDIVTKADEAIESGRFSADLRFGHDYPILALASYLGLEGVGDRLSVEELRSNWYGFQNVPFAVNLQMIFYRDKKGDILVKFLYNEKETLLRGLKPVEGPYYRWDTVKANIKGYLR